MLQCKIFPSLWVKKIWNHCFRLNHYCSQFYLFHFSTPLLFLTPRQIPLTLFLTHIFIPSFPFPSSLRSQRPGLSLHPCSPRVVSFLHCRTPEKCSGYRTGTCGRPQSCPQMSAVLGGAEAVRFGLGEDTLGSRLCVQLMEGSKRLGLGHFWGKDIPEGGVGLTWREAEEERKVLERIPGRGITERESTRCWKREVMCAAEKDCLWVGRGSVYKTHQQEGVSREAWRPLLALRGVGGSFSPAFHSSSPSSLFFSPPSSVKWSNK